MQLRRTCVINGLVGIVVVVVNRWRWKTNRERDLNDVRAVNCFVV